MHKKMDIVITWVDGSDEAWLAERKKYETKDLPIDAVGDRRFRDWGFLKYWFRGIEQNAPFAKNIYFVTYGHIPDWLNTNHHQIRIVKHSDFIPKEYLPTYNSVAIELNFHRIPGIGKRFIYFNDDMFLLKPATLEDYIAKDGRIKYNFIESAMTSTGTLDPTYRDILINTIEVINRQYKKRRFKNLTLRDPFVLRNNLKAIAFKKYIGYQPHHFSSVYDREVMNQLWAEHGDILDATARSKFRNKEIIAPDIIELTQASLGMTRPYYARKRERYLEINKQTINDIKKIITNPTVKEVCLNDAGADDDFTECRQAIIEAFEGLFPKKSKFEK